MGAFKNEAIDRLPSGQISRLPGKVDYFPKMIFLNARVLIDRGVVTVFSKIEGILPTFQQSVAVVNTQFIEPCVSFHCQLFYCNEVDISDPRMLRNNEVMWLSCASWTS